MLNYNITDSINDNINNLIEELLLDIFITNDLNYKDKKMIYILIDIQKKNNFEEIKYIFIISILFSLKKIIDQSYQDRSNFLKFLTYKIGALFATRIYANKFTNIFHEYENEDIDELINSCSKNFSLHLKNYIIREIENNNDVNIVSIKFEYHNNYYNILTVFKIFIEVCFNYIKIINNIVSLYVIPITTKDVSISAYLKVTIANIYIMLLFNSTYKRTKSSDTLKPDANVSSFNNIEDMFNNLDKIIEKDTLKMELESLDKKIIENILHKNLKKKYTFIKYSEEILKAAKKYQLYETIVSIIVNKLSILSVTDRFKQYFEMYSLSLTTFKHKLKNTYFFIDVMKNKNFKVSKELQWDNSESNKYIYTLINVNLEYIENENVVTIIKNANLEFECGKVHYIHGCSGSGKSTLLLALIKRIKRMDGVIKWFGYDNFSYFSIRKYITFISCHTTLFDKSIYYNIIYGINKNVLKEKHDEIMTVIEKYMTLFNLKQMIPTIKIKNSKKISKGQEQRIIAVSLFLDIIYNNKKLIILDEFICNVDTDNEEIIFKELKNIQEMYGLTIFYTSHNYSNIKYSHYNYTIDSTTKSIDKKTTNTIEEKYDFQEEDPDELLVE
jgi:ABC-type multidrug transport system fused ATPase/permease subunit